MGGGKVFEPVLKGMQCLKVWYALQTKLTKSTNASPAMLGKSLSHEPSILEPTVPKCSFTT